MKRSAPHAPLLGLCLALAAAFPAAAQTNEELLKELRTLRDRVNELERKLQQAPAATAPAAPARTNGELPMPATLPDFRFQIPVLPPTLCADYGTTPWIS